SPCSVVEADLAELPPGVRPLQRSVIPGAAHLQPIRLHIDLADRKPVLIEVLSQAAQQLSPRPSRRGLQPRGRLGAHPKHPDRLAFEAAFVYRTIGLPAEHEAPPGLEDEAAPLGLL